MGHKRHRPTGYNEFDLEWPGLVKSSLIILFLPEGTPACMFCFPQFMQRQGQL